MSKVSDAQIIEERDQVCVECGQVSDKLTSRGMCAICYCAYEEPGSTWDERGDSPPEHW